MWFAVIAVLCGVGLLFVRVDYEETRRSFVPGIALLAFPIYRFGLAALCFVIGLACVGHLLGFW